MYSVGLAMLTKVILLPMLSAISTSLTHRLEPALYIAALALLVAGGLVWPVKDRAAEERTGSESLLNK